MTLETNKHTNGKKMENFCIKYLNWSSNTLQFRDIFSFFDEFLPLFIFLLSRLILHSGLEEEEKKYADN